VHQHNRLWLSAKRVTQGSLAIRKNIPQIFGTEYLFDRILDHI